VRIGKLELTQKSFITGKKNPAQVGLEKTTSTYQGNNRR
jgi:hypothetical protein